MAWQEQPQRTSRIPWDRDAIPLGIRAKFCKIKLNENSIIVLPDAKSNCTALS